LELYLERFSEFLLSIFLRADWISRVVSPHERITRFIMSERWIDTAKGIVRSGAFLPSKKSKVISVYRTSGCTETKVWLLGRLFVERKRKDRARIVGRADLGADAALKEGLRIQPLRRPHTRHAEFSDWPDDKARQKDKAVALAQASVLRFPPANPLLRKYGPWIRRANAVCAIN
jgi:hypothetical protein